VVQDYPQTPQTPQTLDESLKIPSAPTSTRSSRNLTPERSPRTRAKELASSDKRASARRTTRELNDEDGNKGSERRVSSRKTRDFDSKGAGRRTIELTEAEREQRRSRRSTKGDMDNTGKERRKSRRATKGEIELTDADKEHRKSRRTTKGDAELTNSEKERRKSRRATKGNDELTEAKKEQRKSRRTTRGDSTLDDSSKENRKSKRKSKGAKQEGRKNLSMIIDELGFADFDTSPLPKSPAEPANIEITPQLILPPEMDQNTDEKETRGRQVMEADFDKERIPDRSVSRGRVNKEDEHTANRSISRGRNINEGRLTDRSPSRGRGVVTDVISTERIPERSVSRGKDHIKEVNGNEKSQERSASQLKKISKSEKSVSRDYEELLDRTASYASHENAGSHHENEIPTRTVSHNRNENISHNRFDDEIPARVASHNRQEQSHTTEIPDRAHSLREREHGDRSRSQSRTRAGQLSRSNSPMSSQHSTADRSIPASEFLEVRAALNAQNWSQISEGTLESRGSNASQRNSMERKGSNRSSLERNGSGNSTRSLESKLSRQHLSNVIEKEGEKVIIGQRGDSHRNRVKDATAVEGVMVSEGSAASEELKVGERTRNFSNNSAVGERTRNFSNNSAVGERTRNFSNNSAVGERTRNISSNSNVGERQRNPSNNSTINDERGVVGERITTPSNYSAGHERESEDKQTFEKSQLSNELKNERERENKIEEQQSETKSERKRDEARERKVAVNAKKNVEILRSLKKLTSNIQKIRKGNRTEIGDQLDSILDELTTTISDWNEISDDEMSIRNSVIKRKVESTIMEHKRLSKLPENADFSKLALEEPKRQEKLSASPLKQIQPQDMFQKPPEDALPVSSVDPPPATSRNQETVSALTAHPTATSGMLSKLASSTKNTDPKKPPIRTWRQRFFVLVFDSLHIFANDSPSEVSALRIDISFDSTVHIIENLKGNNGEPLCVIEIKGKGPNLDGDMVPRQWYLQGAARDAEMWVREMSAIVSRKRAEMPERSNTPDKEVVNKRQTSAGQGLRKSAYNPTSTDDNSNFINNKRQTSMGQGMRKSAYKGPTDETRVTGNQEYHGVGDEDVQKRGMSTVQGLRKSTYNGEEIQESSDIALKRQTSLGQGYRKPTNTASEDNERKFKTTEEVKQELLVQQRRMQGDLSKKNIGNLDEQDVVPRNGSRMNGPEEIDGQRRLPQNNDSQRIPQSEGSRKNLGPGESQDLQRRPSNEQRRTDDDMKQRRPINESRRPDEERRAPPPDSTPQTQHQIAPTFQTGVPGVIPSRVKSIAPNRRPPQKEDMKNNMSPHMRIPLKVPSSESLDVRQIEIAAHSPATSPISSFPPVTPLNGSPFVNPHMQQQSPALKAKMVPMQDQQKSSGYRRTMAPARMDSDRRNEGADGRRRVDEDVKRPDYDTRRADGQDTWRGGPPQSYDQEPRGPPPHGLPPTKPGGGGPQYRPEMPPPSSYQQPPGGQYPSNYSPYQPQPQPHQRQQYPDDPSSMPPSRKSYYPGGRGSGDTGQQQQQQQRFGPGQQQQMWHGQQRPEDWRGGPPLPQNGQNGQGNWQQQQHR
ncbi:hypothetical protein HK096_010901, partial [Nowakowskiella sp. JEL0078]